MHCEALILDHLPEVQRQAILASSIEDQAFHMPASWTVLQGGSLLTEHKILVECLRLAGQGVHIAVMTSRLARLLWCDDAAADNASLQINLHHPVMR